MQTSKSHLKIPKALINAPEELLTQKIQDKHGYSDRRKTYEEESISQATEYALLKYYPKYCHTIRLDSDPKSRPVLHRIKLIKSIHNFEYDLGSPHKEQLITKTLKKLLGNKRKSIKSLPIIAFEEEHGYRVRHIPAIEMSYFFPYIQNLNVSIPLPGYRFAETKHDFISADLEDDILESYGYFWNYLKHVKHIEMSTVSPNLWVIFSYLQKSQGFLASLQTFRLTIMSLYKNDTSEDPKKIFLVFLRNPDLLKYVTHINFQRFKDYVDRGWFHYYGDQIKSILDSCPRLQTVTFPIEEEFYSSQHEFLGPKHYLTRAPLQSFKNLQGLTLMVYDTKSLMDGFDFPEQLKKLTLRLYNLAHVWKTLYPETKDESLEDYWIENEDDKEKSPQGPLLPNFFEKVSKLAELNSLELNMRLFTFANDILNVFIVPMLQRVPTLEKFEWNFYQNRWRSPPSNLLDLSIFLQGITSLSQLKSFKISHPVEDDIKLAEGQGLMITFSPQVAQEKFSFPNIHSINIDALISEDFDFRAFFAAFSESSSQTKPKEIALGKIYINSIQSFIKLLKIFKELEQLPNLKISLSLVLILQGWEDIDKNFEEAIIPAKNVSITLKIYVSIANRFASTANRIEALQKIFGKMKFSVTQLAKEKTRRGGEKQSFMPFIENNYEYVE